ncbi:MAG: hypothetical protein IJ877_07500 [Candidatus Gastranaerophilales bacterium]|nr:hypothetical protein [Candidatus Gastranaerophilales bacterium]
MKINPISIYPIVSKNHSSGFNHNRCNTKFSGMINEDTFIASKSKEDLSDFLKRKNYITRKVDYNIYAGETLANKPDEVFKQLFKSGITTIIDLRSQDEVNISEYKRKCQENGITYSSHPLSSILDDIKTGIFDYKTGSVQDEFVDNLAGLLDEMREGNVYLGCQHGIERTNFALVADYVFNFNTTHYPPVIYPANYGSRNALKNKNLDLIRKIIKKLSLQQRKKLGLPDDFEQTILKQRIKDIIEINKKPFPKEVTELIEANTKYEIKE